MAITIRKPAESDEPQWRELWQGYLEFYRTSLPEPTTASVWRRLLDVDGPLHGFVAEMDGQLVGLTHYLFHPVTWSEKDRCYLEDLFVAKAARRDGVGKQLIEAVYESAAAANTDQVYWLTEQNNDTARSLYDAVGQSTPFIKYRNRA